MEVRQLLDLEPNLIHKALRCLGARERTRARRVCKLFSVLVDEIHSETPCLAATIADDDDVLSVLEPQLQAPPTTGFLLTNSRLTAERARAIAQRLPPSLHLLAAHAESLVGTDVTGNLESTSSPGKTALTLMATPEVEVNSLLLPFDNVHGPPGVSWIDMCAPMLSTQGAIDCEPWNVIVVTGCGGSGAQALAHVTRLLQEAHPAATIIGGVAMGAALVRAYGGRVERTRDGVGALMFRGNVPLSAVVCRGTKTAKRLAALKDELGAKDILGAAMFSCCARDMHADARAFVHAFPSVPLVGNPAAGEIGPAYDDTQVISSGNARLQSYVAVFGVFAVPKRLEAAKNLYFEDLELEWRSRANAAANSARGRTAQVDLRAEALAELGAGFADDDDSDVLDVDGDSLYEYAEDPLTSVYTDDDVDVLLMDGGSMHDIVDD